MLIEYPGYGVYHNHHPSEKLIFEDALIVLDFVLNDLKFNKNNIIIFGRSIGSGPATYMASHIECHSLILMSPFISIKKIANDKFSFLSFFVKNSFNNEKNMSKVKSPVYIIHGK